MSNTQDRDALDCFKALQWEVVDVFVGRTLA